MPRILVKNGLQIREFNIPYPMFYASEKLRKKYGSGTSREPFIITDVEIDLFDTFVELFEDYYSNNTDKETNIPLIVESVFTKHYKVLIVKLMNFIHSYEFHEIHIHFKKRIHQIVDQKTPQEYRNIFNLVDDLNDREKLEIMNNMNSSMSNNSDGYSNSNSNSSSSNNSNTSSETEN